MKALVQRVSEASVTVEGKTVGSIGKGVLVFFCAEAGDDESKVSYLAKKVANLRIFPDEAGKMNRSVSDVGGAVLCVSQFTLAANMQKGNRPSFDGAAEPNIARTYYEQFCQVLKEMGVSVAEGRFAAHMDVQLVNHGPVTILIEA